MHPRDGLLNEVVASSSGEAFNRTVNYRLVGQKNGLPSEKWLQERLELANHSIYPLRRLGFGVT